MPSHLPAAVADATATHAPEAGPADRASYELGADQLPASQRPSNAVHIDCREPAHIQRVHGSIILAVLLVRAFSGARIFASSLRTRSIALIGN